MDSSNFFDDIPTDSDFVEKCLDRFDLDKDDALNNQEMTLLVNELFCDCNGDPYSLPSNLVPEIFRCFDVNNDELIDSDELRALWDGLIVPMVKPCCAIIIIDVQNDFIDGSLAVMNSPAGEEGEEVVPAINDLLKAIPFQHVFYSFDWHPENHISFIDNVFLYEFDDSSPVSQEQAELYDTVIFKGPPRTEQKLWPVHCVQDTWGSQLHRDLYVPEGSHFTYKGISPNVDSYSAFWDNQKTSSTSLAEDLKSRNVTDVFVCGLVYDFCVGSTALHSLELGFKTILIEDACKCLTEGGRDAMREDLIQKNAAIVESSDVLALVEGRDRKPELGLTLLQQLGNSS